MHKLLFTLLLLITQSIFSQNQDYDVVFTNVNIVSMTNNQVVEKQNIGIKNNLITYIGKDKIKAKQTINLKGQYIMPSLADAHIHLPQKEEELQRFLEINLINGVTKLRSMRGDWKHKAWKEKYNTNTSIYPKLFLSAPPIFRDFEPTTTEIEEFVNNSKDYNFGFIKILSIKSQKIFKEIDSICKKYNMPLGGHFPRLASGNSLSEEVFFNSNYKSIEHLGGLTSEPNLFESRIQAIKKNNIFICPTLSWYSIGSGQYSYEELQKLPGMEYVSKETMQEWLGKSKAYRDKTGEKALKEEVIQELKYLDEKYEVIARLQKENIKMILSPDASSKYMMAGCNMITEMELLQKAKLSNFEILQMATTNFALFYNENNGLIQTGKEADFIVLEKNPLQDLQTLKNIKGVYFNTNFLNEKALIAIKNKLLASPK